MSVGGEHDRRDSAGKRARMCRTSLTTRSSTTATGDAHKLFDFCRRPLNVILFEHFSNIMWKCARTSLVLILHSSSGRVCSKPDDQRCQNLNVFKEHFYIYI